MRARRHHDTSPGELALQFAERGHFSQVRAFAGEVLYTAGMPASHLYVVREGEVDLYLVQDEKRTVVETLRPGQCFGVEPHLQAHVRSHNAAARSYCELYLIDNAALAGALGDSADLVRGMLDTLSARLSAAHRVIATRVNYQPDLLIYAQLLQLLGQADLGKPALTGRAAAGQPAPLARPLLQDVFSNARLMFGHSDRHISNCVNKLVALHLVRVDDERGSGKQLLFAPRDIVAQVRKVVAADVDADKLSYEYISVGEFAELVDADRGQVLRKLAASEFADDVFTFRRTEVLRLLNQKGKRFFADRKLKPPAEFSDITDIEFADNKSLMAVVGRLDAFDLAKVLTLLDEGPARARVLNALSRRRREELETELQALGSVDPVEAQQLAQALIGEIRATMLKQAG